MCPNYIVQLRNTNSHLLQVYLGAWSKIEISIEIMSVELLIIDNTRFKHYPSTYCLCKVDISFEPTFKLLTFYFNIRITTSLSLIFTVYH